MNVVIEDNDGYRVFLNLPFSEITNEATTEWEIFCTKVLLKLYQNENTYLLHTRKESKQEKGEKIQSEFALNLPKNYSIENFPVTEDTVRKLMHNQLFFLGYIYLVSVKNLQSIYLDINRFNEYLTSKVETYSSIEFEYCTLTADGYEMTYYSNNKSFLKFKEMIKKEQRCI